VIILDLKDLLDVNWWENLRLILYDYWWIVTNACVIITQLYYNSKIFKSFSVAEKTGEYVYERVIFLAEEKDINHFNYKERIELIINELNKNTKIATEDCDNIIQNCKDYIFSMKLALGILFIYEYSRFDILFFLLCVLIFSVVYKSIKERCLSNIKLAEHNRKALTNYKRETESYLFEVENEFNKMQKEILNKRFDNLKKLINNFYKIKYKV
jgi:hypothetical protein